MPKYTLKAGAYVGPDPVNRDPNGKPVQKPYKVGESFKTPAGYDLNMKFDPLGEKFGVLDANDHATDEEWNGVPVEPEPVRGTGRRASADNPTGLPQVPKVAAPVVNDPRNTNPPPLLPDPEGERVTEDGDPKPTKTTETHSPAHKPLHRGGR